MGTHVPAQMVYMMYVGRLKSTRLQNIGTVRSISVAVNKILIQTNMSDFC